MKVTHPTANFEIELPDDWVRNEDSDNFQFISPGENASVTISAYGSDGGTFEEFVDFRWSSVQDFYEQICDQWELDQPKMIVREYQGIWPEESEPTYYLVACAHVSEAYLSIGIVTDPLYRSRNDKMLNDILRSIEKVKS